MFADIVVADYSSDQSLFIDYFQIHPHPKTFYQNNLGFIVTNTVLDLNIDSLKKYLNVFKTVSALFCWRNKRF